MKSDYSNLGIELVNFEFMRFSSGAYRLEILGKQAYNYFTKYLLGFFDSNNLNQYLLGNFYLSSGFKGGIVCLILSYIFFF